MCWNIVYGILLLFSTIVTWGSGLLLDAINGKERSDIRRRKTIVAGVAVAHIFILFIFKYLNYSINILNKIFVHVDIVPLNFSSSLLLPVGISFYTFQALGYIIEIYRREVPCARNLFKYALFHSFFPQLVAGPIERSRNLLIQFDEKHVFSKANLILGLKYMLIGMYKKVAIADPISIYVNGVFNQVGDFSGLSLLLAVFFIHNSNIL